MPDQAPQAPPDLDALLGPIVSALIPGWTVTSEWKAADKMPVAGALAVCEPTPTRSLAHVSVLAPWPEGESLPETLWHELTHALLSPLTALVEDSAGAVMVEEPIVERLGNLLATLPARARAAVVRAVETYTPRLRARISARAPLARGGSMDAKEVLAAITGQDEGKALEILTGWVAEQINAATGGGGPAEPDGDEPTGDPMAKDKPPVPPKPGDGAPPPAGDAAARARLALDGELARARAVRAELETMVGDMRKSRVDDLITSLRARLPSGHKGLAATEKDILAAKTYQEAKQIHDLAVRFAPEDEAPKPRARMGDRTTAAPALDKAQIVKPADFDKFDPAFQGMFLAVAENEGQEAADAMLRPARARLSRDATQGRV
ncbi:MAG TPA: hypothetical protein VLT61_12175 [Anaeromyxobacteraceae bacterium]|nr:hypothetical protein [Anaeromyxobacteraceae bacterium]